MIEVEHLVKSYGTNLALDDVSFSVGEREILGLLGPNGAGKSTAMNIMTGYLSANAGTVRIDGKDILEHPGEAKKRIGFLPETPPLYGDMRVEEYLRFVYELKQCTYNRDAHLEEVCRVTRLYDARQRIIKNLSTGYRQRLGIAQALVGNPKVLILDEPTVGLDPKQIIEVRNLIRTLGREHTVILSSHILSEVQAVCDRVVILDNGKVLCDEKTNSISRAVQQNTRIRVRVCGPQKEVLEALRAVPQVSSAMATGERERDSFSYFVESAPGTDVRKGVFFAMAQREWPIVGMEEEGYSLEDVFLKLTETGDLSGAGKKHRK